MSSEMVSMKQRSLLGRATCGTAVSSSTTIPTLNAGGLFALIVQLDRDRLTF